MGPSGTPAPRASISPLRSGRSHTNSLSFTRHWHSSRESRSLVSGNASAMRRTSSQVGMPKPYSPGFPRGDPQREHANIITRLDP